MTLVVLDSRASVVFNGVRICMLHSLLLPVMLLTSKTHMDKFLCSPNKEEKIKHVARLPV